MGKEGRVWTKAEHNALRELYPYASKREISEKLPYKTWAAIMGKAHKLRLRRFHR